MSAFCISDSQFLQRLEDSGLAGDSIAAICDSIPPGLTDEQLAEHLTKASIITGYQAEAILGKRNSPLVIRDYEVINQIGRGGMGYVLKARHRKMDHKVPIKFILPTYTESEEVRQRFDDGSLYLVMRYVDGKDLSTRVRQEAPLSVTNAIDVICQAARGLACAHEQGIVHRDIKPGNLLLDQKGVVRILDMGLARMRPSPGDDDQRLTNTGSMMGTVDYMAPEQAMNARTADHRADIYSLGCTLYFLLTGKAPYASDSMMTRLLAHRDAPIPMLCALRSDIPQELESIYIRMMAKDRDHRYQSMDEVIAGLSAIDVEDDDDTTALETHELPEDGSGGFIQLPPNEPASEESSSRPTFIPDDNSHPTIPNGSRPPVQPLEDTVRMSETASAGRVSPRQEFPTAELLDQRGTWAGSHGRRLQSPAAQSEAHCRPEDDSSRGECRSGVSDSFSDRSRGGRPVTSPEHPAHLRDR